MKSIDQNKLRDNDSRSLEVDGLPAVVIEILDVEQRRLNIRSSL